MTDPAINSSKIIFTTENEEDSSISSEQVFEEITVTGEINRPMVKVINNTSPESLTLENNCPHYSTINYKNRIGGSEGIDISVSNNSYEINTINNNNTHTALSIHKRNPPDSSTIIEEIMGIGPNKDHDLPTGYYKVYDDGGSLNYSNNKDYETIFDAGDGHHHLVKIIDFNFESTTEYVYDYQRFEISDNKVDWEKVSVPWFVEYSGVFGTLLTTDTSSPDLNGSFLPANMTLASAHLGISDWLEPTLEFKKRYLRIRFHSDLSVVGYGWNYEVWSTYYATREISLLDNSNVIGNLKVHGNISCIDGNITVDDNTVLNITGTDNEIEVSNNNNNSDVTIGLPDNVTITGNLSVNSLISVGGDVVIVGADTTGYSKLSVKTSGTGEALHLTNDATNSVIQVEGGGTTRDAIKIKRADGVLHLGCNSNVYIRTSLFDVQPTTSAVDTQIRLLLTSGEGLIFTANTNTQSGIKVKNATSEIMAMQFNRSNGMVSIPNSLACTHGTFTSLTSSGDVTCLTKLRTDSIEPYTAARIDCKGHFNVQGSSLNDGEGNLICNNLVQGHNGNVNIYANAPMVLMGHSDNTGVIQLYGTVKTVSKIETQTIESVHYDSPIQLFTNAGLHVTDINIGHSGRSNCNINCTNTNTAICNASSYFSSPIVKTDTISHNETGTCDVFTDANGTCNVGNSTFGVQLNGNVGIGSGDLTAQSVSAASATLSDNLYIDDVVNASGVTPLLTLRKNVDGHNGAGPAIDFKMNAYGADRYLARISALHPHSLYGDLAFSTWNSQSSPAALKEHMRIVGGGNVGIGYTSPSEKLHVSGNVKAGTTILTSDDRIKYHEHNLTNCLDTINKLTPQKYEKIKESRTGSSWIPTNAEWDTVKSDFEWGDEYGFVAQSVKAIPELSFLVTGSETDEFGNQTPLGLNYDGIFTVAVGAIKELSANLDAEKTKTQEFSARVAALEARVATLEAAGSN